MDIADLGDKILKQDRRALARAITLVESSRPDHRSQAAELIEYLKGKAQPAVRIGLSGTPGVGKSTFIESFGMMLTGQGLRVAVLAVDPSSARSGGSILGDKTRMERLSRDPNAFIRPSPSQSHLGGVARRTREAVSLCEAAGFDVVLIETVGVGQSETVVAEMSDLFILLLAPAGGDELQGVKRGIMEMADSIVINKADSGNQDAARRAVTEYKNALHLFPPTESGWTPRVTTASALENKGVDEVWDIVDEYVRHTTAKGYFEERRKDQSVYWLNESIQYELQQAFYGDKDLRGKLEQYKADVQEGRVSSYKAARELLALFRGRE